MMTKLLKISGLELNDNEHEIIENEFLEMTKEIEILSSLSCEKNDFSTNSIPYSNLRADIISKSSDKKDVLSNSKSKNNDGFVVTKII